MIAELRRLHVLHFDGDFRLEKIVFLQHFVDSLHVWVHTESLTPQLLEYFIWVPPVLDALVHAKVSDGGGRRSRDCIIAMDEDLLVLIQQSIDALADLDELVAQNVQR